MKKKKGGSEAPHLDPGIPGAKSGLLWVGPSVQLSPLSHVQEARQLPLQAPCASIYSPAKTAGQTGRDPAGRQEESERTPRPSSRTPRRSP